MKLEKLGLLRRERADISSLIYRPAIHDLVVQLTGYDYFPCPLEFDESLVKEMINVKFRIDDATHAFNLYISVTPISWKRR